MPFDLKAIQSYVKEHPKTAAVVGVAGAGVVAIALHKKATAPKQDDSQSSAEVGVAPLDDQPQGQPGQYNGYPQVVINTPDTKVPQPATQPPTAFNKIVRDGRTIKVTAGPAGVCPPGYVAAQAPGQPVRCTLVNDARKKKGQHTSYVPSLGQTSGL